MLFKPTKKKRSHEKNFIFRKKRNPTFSQAEAIK